MNIGVAIKETRKEKGLKQNVLAERCNLSASALSKIEHGKDTSFKTLETLASEMKVSTAYLMFRALEDSDISPADLSFFKALKSVLA